MPGCSVRGRLAWIALLVGFVPAAGCRLVSRDQMEECRRLSQSLRTENAQLKDQVLSLRSQNQDLSERSVDDVRRLAQLEEVNRRLATSVQTYQDERGRLEAAYKDLRASLPESIRPLSLRQPDEPGRQPDSEAAWLPRGGTPALDDAVEAADGARPAPPDSGDETRPRRPSGGWAPSRRVDAGRSISDRGDP